MVTHEDVLHQAADRFRLEAVRKPLRRFDRSGTHQQRTSQRIEADDLLHNGAQFRLDGAVDDIGIILAAEEQRLGLAGF